MNQALISPNHEMERLLEQRLQDCLKDAPSTPKDYARDSIYFLIRYYFHNALLAYGQHLNCTFEEYFTDILTKNADIILFMAQTVVDFTSDPFLAINTLREPERKRALAEQAEEIARQRGMELESELRAAIADKKAEMMASIKTKAQALVSGKP